jgi:hypothetical protein
VPATASRIVLQLSLAHVSLSLDKSAWAERDREHA